MIKGLAFFIVGLISLAVSQAQSANGVPDNIRATNAIDDFINNTASPGYLLYGISGGSGEVIGSVYLEDAWRMTTLKIRGYDQELSNYPGKLNIYSNQIEINHQNVVKVIDGSRVERFTWIDESTGKQAVFHNASEFKIKNATPTGFVEELVPGKLPLLKKTQVIVKKPDYSIQLNVGSKNTRIIHEKTLYFSAGNELVPVKSIKNKNFTKIFGEQSSLMNSFIREKSLRISDENDLITIFKHYNDVLQKNKGL